jgi:hypothetical protein
MKLWWLSFCDPERPEGERSLGACIVPGASLEAAMKLAWASGCNPGGEIEAFELPFEDPPAPFPLLTLMSKADIERYDGMVE